MGGEDSRGAAARRRRAVAGRRSAAYSGAVDRYLHGTAPPEQDRLSLLNALLNEHCLRFLRIRAGERVLDVGSGLGQLARAIARAGARVVGVERDKQQLEAARRLAAAAGEEGLVEFRRGDAAAPPLLPGEAGTFDVAHARYVLEHVRDPGAVVRAMARAVRPGGRVVLFDDDHDVMRVWPRVPEFDAWWNAYQRGYEAVGTDPLVGRRLTSLLHAAGARPARAEQLPFGACAGEPAFAPLVDNLLRVLATTDELMLEEGLRTEADLAAARAAMARWRALPDAAIWYVVNAAEGVREA